MYRVTIEQVNGDVSPLATETTPLSGKIKLYEQTVAELNLLKVMAAVNSKLRKQRERKAKVA